MCETGALNRILRSEDFNSSDADRMALDIVFTARSRITEPLVASGLGLGTLRRPALLARALQAAQSALEFFNLLLVQYLLPLRQLEGLKHLVHVIQRVPERVNDLVHLLDGPVYGGLGRLRTVALSWWMLKTRSARLPALRSRPLRGSFIESRMRRRLVTRELGIKRLGLASLRLGLVRVIFRRGFVRMDIPLGRSLGLREGNLVVFDRLRSLPLLDVRRGQRLLRRG